MAMIAEISIRGGALATAMLALLGSLAFASEYHVSTDGADENPGTPATPLRTIQRAADLAQPGDTVTVHEGIYRERVNPPRGGTSDDKRITYQAAAGEKVTIKGSEIVTGWKKVAGDTWKVTLPNSIFGEFNPYSDVIGGEWYKQKNFPHHTGAVYFNGIWLDEAKTVQHTLAPVRGRWLWKAEVGEDSTEIWAQFKDADPNQETVEINVRQTILYPDQPGRNYITVRGFNMHHAATPWAGAMSEQVGLIGTHWSKGWVIEDNVISHSVCTGITLGRYRLNTNMPPATAEGYVTSIELALENGWSKETIGGHVIRNNRISHCEKNGIHGSLGGIFSVIEGNAICDVAVRGWLSGADIAGLKLLGSHDTIIRNNHIYRCRGTGGIWLDWMAHGARVTGNLLHDNTQDLFMEVNHGPFLIDNNLFLSAKSLRDWSEGGAYAHNLFAGSMTVRPVPQRHTPFHESHSTELAGLQATTCGDDRFHNNLFVGGRITTRGYDKLQAMQMSGNVYLAGAKASVHDRDSVQLDTFDSGIKLEEANGDWWLEMTIDPSWTTMKKRELVTTELLGKARVPCLPFEQPDGGAYRLDRDYFDRPRDPERPDPGPFAFRGDKALRLKVWPNGVVVTRNPHCRETPTERSF